jgi:hypothetical protein
MQKRPERQNKGASGRTFSGPEVATSRDEETGASVAVELCAALLVNRQAMAINHGRISQIGARVIPPGPLKFRLTNP